MEAFWIIIIGSLVAINCSLVGSYLILRRMAMIGDAISHAVLPGIVIAFLLTGSRSPFIMMIGAGALGLITPLLISFFHRQAALQLDASIGINFTWLFALGVILVSMFTGKIDLDQECVLYGEIAYVPLDLWITDSGINLGPRPLYILALALLINLFFIISNYRVLFITSFDAPFAKSIGIRTTLCHYILMGTVAMTTVASFDSVGAIVVVALLVIPPATAYLLTKKLHKVLIYAALLGILSTIGGYCLASFIDGSIAGAMATFSGILFMLVLLGGNVLKKCKRVKN